MVAPYVDLLRKPRSALHRSPVGQPACLRSVLLQDIDHIFACGAMPTPDAPMPLDRRGTSDRSEVRLHARRNVPATSPQVSRRSDRKSEIIGEFTSWVIILSSVRAGGACIRTCIVHRCTDIRGPCPCKEDFKCPVIRRRTFFEKFFQHIYNSPSFNSSEFMSTKLNSQGRLLFL